ncbi:MAG: hypothetical protein ACBR12_20465 [Microcoleus sp.]
MPLPIYSTHGNDPKYRSASALYDEARAIADIDKTTATKKFREALRLLESCDETAGAELVREEIRKLGG